MTGRDRSLSRDYHASLVPIAPLRAVRAYAIRQGLLCAEARSTGIVIKEVPPELGSKHAAMHTVELLRPERWWIILGHCKRDLTPKLCGAITIRWDELLGSAMLLPKSNWFCLIWHGQQVCYLFVWEESRARICCGQILIPLSTEHLAFFPQR